MKNKQTNLGHYFLHSKTKCEKGSVSVRFTVWKIEALERNDRLLPLLDESEPLNQSPAYTDHLLSIVDVYF